MGRVLPVTLVEHLLERLSLGDAGGLLQLIELADAVVPVDRVPAGRGPLR